MKYLFAFFVVAIFLSSCQSTPKDIAYFQDLDARRQQLMADQVGFSVYEPVIKINDQLLITVSAPVLDQSLVAQFNLPMNSYLAPGETTTQKSPAVLTYTVDKNGSINFPVIGQIKLSGMTKSEAVQFIASEVSKYVTHPIVNLQIVSFTVTVLGEVMRPGTIQVESERVSVLDAIGGAGDLTLYGDRKNVLLIRDNGNGKEFVRFDLTKSDIFTSPYFYLQQNDVLVIEPNDTRKKISNFGAAENYRLSVFSTILSTVSVLSSLAIAIVSLNN